VKRYSSGMYVCLAFAVAAHLEPEILIVDEVLAVGDTEFQRKCLGRMNHVCQPQICWRLTHYVTKPFISIKAAYGNIVAEYMQNTIEMTRMLVKCGQTKHFRSFTMRDRDGTERDSFQIGEDIVFDIELHSDEFIDHPRCGIAI